MVDAHRRAHQLWFEEHESRRAQAHEAQAVIARLERKEGMDSSDISDSDPE
jgi:hypothetical protein